MRLRSTLSPRLPLSPAQSLKATASPSSVVLRSPHPSQSTAFHIVSSPGSELRMLSENVQRAHVKLQEALSLGRVTASLDGAEGRDRSASLPSVTRSPSKRRGLHSGSYSSGGTTLAAAGSPILLDGVDENGDGGLGEVEGGAAGAFHSALEEAAVLIPDDDHMDDALAACRLHRCDYVCLGGLMGAVRKLML